MKKNLLAALVVTAGLVAGCSAPQNIVYFQDTTDREISTDVQPSQIRFRPEDEISIIVNCPSAELMAQFNLPYITRRIGQSGASSLTASGNNTGVCGYTVNADGDIDFPVIGRIHIAGLTRNEVAALIKKELQSRDLVKDPVVTVEFMNLTISVMGEVARPGRYSIARDHVTILDALAQAGDLTITGRRDNIRVIREEGGVQKTYLLDLRSAEGLTKSPAYYLNQNDVIYVEPNEMRTRQSTVNGNTVMSASFWISIASLAATLTSTVTVVALRLQNM